MINQQVNIDDHIYEEQYFEPQLDIEVAFVAPKALLTLQCMLSGDIKTSCGIHLKEGKLCLHYMPGGRKYSMVLLAGEKYHCFYIIPKLHFLEEFAGDYAPLNVFIHAIHSQVSFHQALPVRRFSMAEHNELSKMKTSMLRGKAAIIYYGNRITDIILLYLEQLDMPVSRENFLVDLYEKEIEALIVKIDASPEEIFPVTELAFKIGISERILETAFKLKRGTTLLLYVQQQRLKAARHLLSITDDSVAHIALSVGYADQSYFSKIFKRETGITPRDYRRSFLVQKGI
jgi:AraC-like DNA-binding protein